MSRIALRDPFLTLQRSRLRSLAEAEGLRFNGKAVKSELVSALIDREPKALEELLHRLTVDELRRLCRASGLDDSGRIPRLVARLLDREQKVIPSTAHGSNGRPAELPLRIEPDPEGQLSLGQLESHLWEAANILRGTIDSSDFKHYIFGLLFYKRLSDVWEEEYEERLRATGDSHLAADPDEHRFQIPNRVLWANVCHDEPGIGGRLNAAFRSIERTNPRLHGVFQDIDFDNRERFPDATLLRLVRHFELHRLRNSDVEPDMLGNAYEFLIAQFADDAGKKGGEFYTPKRVVRLLIECLRPEEGMSIYDPACGSGGMLLEAASYLRRYGQDPGTLSLYGQEMNLNTWAICQTNLFLHDIDDASVLRGDTLRDPKHLRQGRLQQFDRVLANPPFSLKSWGHEEWQGGDFFGRDVYGCPPRSYGDLAFVQHMLASLNPRGKMAVVLPHGILFRSGIEGKIRRGLLEDDLIESVIGLPPNLFYGTGIPAAVLIINRQKSPERRGRILFIDGSREMQEGKNQNFLSESNVERLAQAFHGFWNEAGLSRAVELDEIAEQGFTLHIPRYVQTAAEISPPLDIEAEVAALRLARARRDRCEEDLEQILTEMGLGLGGET